MSETVVSIKRPALADGLPSHFALRPDGVYVLVRQNGEQDWRRLCSPMEVTAMGRDRASGNWGRLVTLTNPDNQTRQVFIPARSFAGDGREPIAMLLDQGLHLEHFREAKRLLIELLSTWQPQARICTVDRLGWLPGKFTTFLAGLDRTIGDEAALPDQGIGAVAKHIRSSGTLEGWRDNVAALSLGNPLLMLGICQAFTGPLLSPLGTEGGGVHLRGPSSRGKTTILRVAVSVWGAPGLLQSWRATDNGLEGVAAALNETLCALDEIGEAPARQVGEIIYMLANGVGKARAGKRGDALRQQEWRLPLLSTGEMSIADKLAEAGLTSKAGMEIRLLDLPADIYVHGAFENLHAHGAPAGFAQALTTASAAHYGLAGPAFVEDLLLDFDAHLERVRDTMRRFRDAARARHGLDTHEGQIHRALERFALMAAAGELAGTFGLTDWPAFAAETAMQYLLGVWIRHRGGLEPAEKRQAIIRVRAFIGQHGKSRFEPIGKNGDGRPIHDRAGFFDGTSYWFLNDAWKTIHSGSDPEQAARYLAEAGFLIKGEGDHVKKRASSAISGRPRLYTVSAAIAAYE